MTTIHDKIEFQVEQLTKSIENLTTSFPDTQVFGTPRARTPVIHIYEIRWLLNSVGEGSVEGDVLESYRESNRNFDQFVNCHRTRYEQSLLEELEWLVGHYPRQVCSFLELDPMENELMESLSRRDSIEILTRYLENESRDRTEFATELEHSQLKVDALDEVLRCRFKRNMEEILNDHLEIERSYFPDEFWWRHPRSLQ